MMRMAEFLSSAQRVSVTVHGAYEAVQQEGDRVEWNEVRNVTLSRPDRLHRFRAKRRCRVVWSFSMARR
jgi:hypothetical protein